MWLAANLAFVALAQAGPPGQAPNGHLKGEISLRGLLAKVLMDAAIYVRPTTASPVLCLAAKDSHLLIVPDIERRWGKVLLTSGGFGFIPATALEIYPTQYYIRGSATPRLVPNPVTLRSQIAEAALDCLGIPYREAGRDLKRGIGSGEFVAAIYRRAGIDIPDQPASQCDIGKPIKNLEDLRPGDRLYFWGGAANRIDQTGIYIGGGYFMQSSAEERKVTKEYLGQRKWLAMLVAARR